MKVAVSVNEAGEIIQHLGKAKLFYVFKKDGDQIDFVEERVTDGNHQNHIIDDIDDCDVVISGLIGQGMVDNLKKLGITAIENSQAVEPQEAISKI